MKARVHSGLTKLYGELMLAAGFDDNRALFQVYWNRFMRHVEKSTDAGAVRGLQYAGIVEEQRFWPHPRRHEDA